MSQDIVNENQKLSYTNLDFSSIYTEVLDMTKQLTKEDVDAREKLIAYCKENKINMAMVAKQYPEVASRGTKKVFDYVLSEISCQLTSLPEAWFLKEGK